jgi:hypothetical protein
LLHVTNKLSVRNWEFLLTTRTFGNLGDTLDPSKMLRRRSSLVVVDMPILRHPVDAKSHSISKVPPSVFEEPESNSLLDSFGF